MRVSLATARASIARRVARVHPGRALCLAGGDALAILVFAGVGRASHQEAHGLDALLQITWTALPFALGWFLVAPFLGAFRRASTDSLSKMLRRTELAWLVAWPAAMLLRLALAPDHALPLPFPFVVLVFLAIFLGVWRGGFALMEGRAMH